MIKVESIIPIVDNSGLVLGKCLKVLSKKSVTGYAGDIIVISARKVIANKKISKGEIFKALLVKTRSGSSRKYGQISFSKENGGILLKKTELIPLFNRLKGCVFLELRRGGFMKLLSLAKYVI